MLKHPLTPRLLPVCGLLFAAGQGQAETRPDWDVSGNMFAASVGINKGTSETGSAAQAGFGARVDHGPLFALWKVRNMTGSDRRHDQQEYNLGYLTYVAGTSIDLHVAYKINDGAHGRGHRYVEYEAELNRTFFNALSVKLQIDTSRNPDDGVYRLEVWGDTALKQRLNDHWSLSEGLSLRRTPSVHYNGANIGLTRKLSPSLIADLRYYDTNRHDLGPKYAGHLALRLTQKFK